MIRYPLFDSRDPKKHVRYVIVSPVPLSRDQQAKILTDWIQKNGPVYQAFDPIFDKPAEVPVPSDFLEQP